MEMKPVLGNRFTNIARVKIKGDGVKFGSFCAIGSGITIITHNHDYELPSVCVMLRKLTRTGKNLVSKGPVIIGNDVWIGDKAILLSGVVIGNGAIIGAGAVVTRPCDPYTINVGSPARAIKKRFREDIIEWLLELEWWNWDDARIARNRQFFSTHLNDHTVKELQQLIVR